MKFGSEYPSCDRITLRYMAAVSLRDRVQTDEVVRCGVDEVEKVTRERRLRWFGHVRRGDKYAQLGTNDL